MFAPGLEEFPTASQNSFHTIVQPVKVSSFIFYVEVRIKINGEKEYNCSYQWCYVFHIHTPLKFIVPLNLMHFFVPYFRISTTISRPIRIKGSNS